MLIVFIYLLQCTYFKRDKGLLDFLLKLTKVKMVIDLLLYYFSKLYGRENISYGKIFIAPFIYKTCYG